MRYFALPCFVGGLLLTAWFVLGVGGAAVARAIASAGWTGLLAITAVHLIVASMMAMAWWNLRAGGKYHLYIWARLVRDAGSELLPLSQVGGYVLGARTAILHGAGQTTTAATVLVDAVLEFCAQLAYIAVGTAALIDSFPLTIDPLWLMLPASLALALAVTRRWIKRLAGWRLIRLFDRAAGWLPGLRTEFQAICHPRTKLLQSFLLHFGAWLLSGVEAWLALSLMGARRGLLLVLAVESFIYATRALAFLVPGSVGVQEGAYLILGPWLGLSPDLALGLSLLKRARDLVIGVPALMSWQVLEHRRWRQAPPPAAAR